MTDQDRFAYHRHLAAIAAEDVRLVTEKDRSYGASWKKRGGIGAFMMLARKWDRLDEILAIGFGYDVFRGIAAARDPGTQGLDGTVLAEVRDLRRYFLLVEAEMVERGAVVPPPKPDMYSAVAASLGTDRPTARSAMLAASYGLGSIEGNLARAIELDDHFDRLEFLRAWQRGDDLAEWFSDPAPKRDGTTEVHETTHRVGDVSTTERVTKHTPAPPADRLGHPYGTSDQPQPVPIEDSNRHADRAVVAGSISLFGTRLLMSENLQKQFRPHGTKDLMRRPPELEWNEREFLENIPPTASIYLRVPVSPVGLIASGWQLNRWLLDDADRAQLDRRPREVNAVEFRELPEVWQGMYTWRGDVDEGKYVMDPQWSELWGR